MALEWGITRNFVLVMGGVGLAMFGETAAIPQYGHGAPQERRSYGGADGWAIVRTANPSYCWMVSGNEDSMWGLSVDPQANVGLIFFAQNHIPVQRINMLVGVTDYLFQEDGHRYELQFNHMGTTNGQDYAYEAELSNQQLAEMRASRFISFTAVYQTERGVGQIGAAHEMRWSMNANRILDECARTIRQ